MHRIILIHPDHKLQSIYKKSMSEHFQIDSAYDGLQGLRMIRNHTPDLIVSEYELPVISGASILRFVRNHHEMFATPFIFLSTNHPAAETLGAGANEWIVTALTNPENLVARCFQHLNIKSIHYV
jgi:DNA-binding response OmpR family regulator